MLDRCDWRLQICGVDGVVPTLSHISVIFSNHFAWYSSISSLTRLMADITALISVTAWITSLDSAWRLRVSHSKKWSIDDVITRALTNSVVDIASKSVLASVVESGDHCARPSNEIISMQTAIDWCSSQNRSRASICSIHLVRHRSLSLWTLASGWVLSISSSSFLWRLGCAGKK